MQQGSLLKSSRKYGPDVWQFRWSEKGLDGKRVYRKRVIGTVAKYPDTDGARRAVTGLIIEINRADERVRLKALTVAQLCDPFEQRELQQDNLWRSYSTKAIYKHI